MNSLAQIEEYMTPIPSSDFSQQYRVVSQEEGTASRYFAELGLEKRVKPLLQRPVWAIAVGDVRYVAAKPIVLRIHCEGDMYFASNNTLNICGYGSTVQESILEAIKHIDYFYKYYRSLRTDQVIGEAVRLKQVFENLLNRE